MILNAYSFFDKKSSSYSVPFFFTHDGLALRAASEVANDPSTTIGRHPADFDLVAIGRFDDQTAQYVHGPANILAVCTSFINNKKGELL